MWIIISIAIFFIVIRLYINYQLKKGVGKHIKKSRLLVHFNNISVVMGATGTGKSQLCAKIISECNRLGINVWSTEPFEGAYKLNLKNDLMMYDISNGYVIIDEASFSLDARSWQDFLFTEMMFFKLHRHFHVHVILLSQGKDDADKKVRELASKIYVLEKSPISKLVIAQRYVITVDQSMTEEDIVKKYNKITAFAKGKLFVWITNKDRERYNSWSAPELPKKDWQVWKKSEETYSEYLAQKKQFELDKKQGKLYNKDRAKNEAQNIAKGSIENEDIRIRPRQSTRS